MSNKLANSLSFATIVRCSLEAHIATGGTVTADEVRRQVVKFFGEPSHPNMWGAAFSAARKSGLVSIVGATNSARLSRKGGVNLVWGPGVNFPHHNYI